ncbi:hypothetical protein Q4R94_07460, partial [Morganella morganii]
CQYTHSQVELINYRDRIIVSSLLFNFYLAVLWEYSPVRLIVKNKTGFDRNNPNYYRWIFI